MSKRLFTSESVTEGHPDKMADQISDTILDAMLKDDPGSRVAVETFLTTGLCLVGGEVTTSTWVDIPALVRETVLGIGYDSSDKGFDGASCGVTIASASSPLTSPPASMTRSRNEWAAAVTRSTRRAPATRA